MPEYGQNTGQGFLPNEPSIESLLKKAGLGEGWDGLNNDSDNEATQHLQENQRSAQDDLMQCYAQVFNSPAGQRVLEDLLNQTLRREAVKLHGAPTMEQCMVYALQRSGQNSIVVYMLQLIQSGQHIGRSEASDQVPADQGDQ
jgi:hypothetical protein